MENAENMKALVREKYGQIAREGGCCGGTSCCGPSAENGVALTMSEDYRNLEGYVEEADLGLGCGIPTDAADLRPGQVVLDLGSGAGNDAFVARGIVGETGKVIGVDMTPDMVKKSRENAGRLGFGNVEFRLGELEALPVDGSSIDRVVSNCVLNLVPDKAGAFSEMFRVLKPGGGFSVSDIVLEGEFPETLKNAAELYVGCLSGAIPKTAYLRMLEQAGFEAVRVAKEKSIVLPEELLSEHLDAEGRKSFAASGTRVLSVTVQGRKPERSADPCCVPLAREGACCAS